MNDPLDQNLYTKFLHAVSEAGEVGGNPLLARLGKVIKDIDQVDDNFVRNSKAESSKLLGCPNMGLDELHTRKFIQMLGETHFYVLCIEHGLNLGRVPEGKDETPDFKSLSDPANYFEVKTPCLKGGEKAIAALMEQSYRGHLDIQDQLDSGRSIGFSEQEIRPYGGVEHEQQVSHMIKALQDKLRQNLHDGQFARVPTYLVCSLLMLTTCGTTAEILRPAYCSRGRYDYFQPITGELWMVAFSECGMLIQSEPEFEGKPSIEGKINRVGILADAEFNYVAGIIFVVYDLSGKSRLLAILRSRDDVNDSILKLVGHDWNDKEDSNGWALRDNDDSRITGPDKVSKA